MRVLIITQDDKLYLPSALTYLFELLPKSVEVVAVVILAVSPFGKKYSIVEKAKETLVVFGLYFFARYTFRYLLSYFQEKSNVEEICRKAGISVIKDITSVNSDDSLRKFRELNPDLIVSIAANQVFKRPLIDLAPKGCLNVHSSLLPRNRGLMPTFWALKHGDTETGVSVFIVDEGIDSGPILVQKKIMIVDRSLDALLKQTKLLGMQAVAEAIDKIDHGSFTLMQNDAEKSTYNRFPSKSDVKQFLNTGNRFF